MSSLIFVDEKQLFFLYITTGKQKMRKLKRPFFKTQKSKTKQSKIYVKHVQQTKETDKIVFLGDKTEKRKFNRCLQRFKKCWRKVIDGEHEETTQEQEKFLKMK